MVAYKRGRNHISACRDDRNTILMAISMFSRNSYQMELSRLMHNLTRRGKSNMALSKPEIPIRQDTNESP